jgi:subfamily B ATP-binding cassette protein HlyB/CyaB
LKAQDPGVFSADELVWGVAALAALFRIPFDAKLLPQQFPPPYSLETLILAAQALGLEGTQSTWRDVARERL